MHDCSRGRRSAVNDIMLNLWWVIPMAIIVMAAIIGMTSEEDLCAPQVKYTVVPRGSVPVMEYHDSRLSVCRYTVDTPARDDTVLHSCSITAEDLQAALRDGLKPYAADFLAAGQAHDVCPVFLASICALESGWGKSDLAASKNNLAGLALSGTYLEFDDPADSIEYLARLIETDYGEEGTYYGGSTDVTGISVHYNPDHAQDWAEAVQEIMDGITRRIDENE